MLPHSRCAHVTWLLYNYKRLSAMDISAHASMKNVAKCDTWCELQNPVNHRVFECKLRPKPFGRGHVCLGVMHHVAPNKSLLGADIGLLCSWCSWLKPGLSPLEGGAGEGESPVVPGPCRLTRRCLRVGLFGNAAPIGRQIPSKAKYWRETDSKQVPRGKDEKDFEKRVKECLKLSGGKRIGAGDASRSDVERRKPVRRSTRGVDRCGLMRRPKPGLLLCPWRCRHVDLGWQRAPSRRASTPARSLHRPTGTPFGPS
ncbi:hypothetical protein Tco_0694525 [Tanacetum coccineum]